MNWAWEQVLPPAQKLLLLALADNANDAGECWPALNSLSTRCEVSRRTAQRMIKDFQESGLLTVNSRFAANGRQTSNGYILVMGTCQGSVSGAAIRAKGEGDKLTPSLQRHGRGDAVDTPRATQGWPGVGATAVAPLEPQTESPLKSPQQPTSLRWPALDGAQRRSIEAQIIALDASAKQSLLDELAIAMGGVPGRIRTTPARYMAGLVKRYAAGAFVPTLHQPGQRRSHPAEPANDGNAVKSQACRPSEAVRQRLAQFTKSVREVDR